MEEATGAPSSLAVWDPKRLRASGRDAGAVMTRPPSPLTMLFSRHTRRREFITLAGGAVAAWPIAARAQQADRMRRIGVFMHFASGDAEGQARIGAFLQGLQEFGWAIGSNVQIDYRWSAGDPERGRRDAAELLALSPGGTSS
jgi:hypothetical protein